MPPPVETSPGLPSHYRWLSQLFPELLPKNDELKARLRDPAAQAEIAADRRLALAVRTLGWALGVERSLLPVLKRKRVTVLVMDCNIGQAKLDYADARRTMTQEQVLRKPCLFPDHPYQQYCRAFERRAVRENRPVWVARVPIPDWGPKDVPSDLRWKCKGWW